MEDLFGENPWGDEPDWAKEEVPESGSGEGGGDETGNIVLVGAQHVLLLVDCHSNMFSEPMELALQLTETILRKRIRETVTLKVGKRNGVGVLLYHTKQDRCRSNKKDPAGELVEDEEDDEDDDEDEASVPEVSTVHELLPLAPPGIQEVQTIRKCLSGERDVQQEFGCSAPNEDEDENYRMAPLQTALEEAIRAFRKAKCVKESASNKPTDPVDTKSIWVLTNRDNPYPTSSLLLQNVARDAKEQGIQIVVWPLVLAGSPDDVEPDNFEMDALFQDIVSYQTFDRRLQSLEELEDGLEDLQQQWKKIRRAYYGPMRLPDWRGRDEEEPSIMIDWFKFVQMAKKPNKVQLDQQTKQETVRVRQLMDDRGGVFATFKSKTSESHQPPNPGLQRLRLFSRFGGEQVPMSNICVKEMKEQANGHVKKPGLIILGFKPNDSIPFHHTMAPSYLIYPNDDVVKGSREAFAELHGSMMRKHVLAIGEILHRLTWTSRLVAIYPIAGVPEEEDEARPRRPPGMRVVTLPFEDDMRALEPDAASEELAVLSGVGDMAMADIVPSEELAIKEDPNHVDSSLSLNEGEMGNVASEDLVKAAVQLVGRQQLSQMELGEDFENAALVEFFNYLESVALEMPVSEEKEDFDTRLDDETVLEAAREQIVQFQHCLPDDVVQQKANGTRKRKLVADDSGLDWEELYRSDEIEECKVPELKKYLRSVGEALSGNKSALVLRVVEHIRQQIDSKKNGKVPVKMET